MFFLNHDSSEKSTYNLMNEWLKTKPQIKTKLELFRRGGQKNADQTAWEGSKLLWVNECKFGLDAKTSRNTYHFNNNLLKLHRNFPNVQRYVIFINPTKTKFRYDVNLEKWVPIIPFTKELLGNLMHSAIVKGNAIPYYVREDRYADLIWHLLNEPQREVDTGVIYKEKSSGSEWNQSLQPYNGVTNLIANNIEAKWGCMVDFVKDFIYYDREYDSIFFDEKKALNELEECFVSKTGRKMKKSKERFLQKIQHNKEWKDKNEI